MPFFLAGLSSATFGVADFLGGLATRKASALTVTTSIYGLGFVAMLIAAPFLGEAPGSADLWWGVAAGATGALGAAIYYHGLAHARISVVAPVAAVVGALAPVAFGVVVGERPEPVAWIGVALAMPAVLLISMGTRKTRAAGSPVRASVLGVSSGMLFGAFGILISRTGEASGMWPLVSARASSAVVLVVVTIAAGRALLPPREVSGLVIAAGVLDLAANVLFLIAVRMELLALIAVIMSMYPASTVALARIVLGDRIDRVQAAGIALAIAAVGLIVVGS